MKKQLRSTFKKGEGYLLVTTALLTCPNKCCIKPQMPGRQKTKQSRLIGLIWGGNQEEVKSWLTKMGKSRYGSGFWLTGSGGSNDVTTTDFPLHSLLLLILPWVLFISRYLLCIWARLLPVVRDYNQ